MLYSFQTSLPRLPVPAVKDTVSRVGVTHPRAEMPASFGSLCLTVTVNYSLVSLLVLSSLSCRVSITMPPHLRVLALARQVFYH